MISKTCNPNLGHSVIQIFRNSVRSQ